MINTARYILSHFEGEKLYAVLGGTHLGFFNDEQLDKTILHLKSYALEKIGASHCTGLKASAKLFQAFNENFFFANVGTSIIIDLKV